MNERRRILVQGIVQGVGFRPFVYGLATRANLAGQVLNEAAGVIIEIEGDAIALDAFTAALRDEAPPLAVIDSITIERLPPADPDRNATFTIRPSRATAGRAVFVSPDVATCEHCLRELFDPADRRYRYPFINCTHCGPRFTIIRSLPYDRPATTMDDFPMCPACRAEYDNPTDRRFHAQPNACPACGPRLALEMVDGEAPASEPLAAAQALLARGLIVAVKGLGGFHLACDATQAEAVDRLRRRKRRWEKPLALMAADITAVRSICHLSEAEERLLTARERPIVLLHRRPDAALAPAVAPGQNTLGVMLPYTPLHHLLLDGAPSPFLVLTSGNLSDEPIAHEDTDARERLAGITDAFLTHNRAIHARCDDSVARVVLGQPRLLRRSRGFAPQPLTLGFDCEAPVLAVGGHLKNCFCLADGRHAYLSHHVGDLDNLETLTAFRDGLNLFKNLFDIEPRLVAHDLHPDYLSTRFALEQDGLPTIAVQHHHAHIAAVLAEHHLAGPVIGVAFDGTGYGPDGTVWGGEFLVADLGDFRRAAYLRHVSLAGGEKAIHEPWRVAAAWLHELYGDDWLDWPLAFCQQLDPQAWRVLRQMIIHNLNSPLTSSIGRLFDAAAALIGLRRTVAYEGQAAMELEAIADEAVQAAYTFDIHGEQVDPALLWDELVADLHAGIAGPVIAAKFHNGMARMIAAVCAVLRNEYGLHQVALGGGVFQNALLAKRAARLLREENFEVYLPERVPANDGGLALGQVAVAANRSASSVLSMIEEVQASPG